MTPKEIQDRVVKILTPYVKDEKALASWQSGLYYVDNTPKSSLGPVRDAIGAVHRNAIADCPGMRLTPRATLKAMPAKLVSDDGRHTVIRPLAYVLEEEARAYAKASDLPVIGCCCPACGDLSLQRQRVKRMLMELEREHPGVKASLLKALGNVAPRHLLDRRLNPPDAPLRRGDDVPAATIADLDPDVASRLLPLVNSVS